MKFRKRTIDQLAEMICGNAPDYDKFFLYRSSSYLTRFFQDCDLEFEHDGSTRSFWVASVLAEVMEDSGPTANAPPEALSRIISELMDQGDAVGEGSGRPESIALLNKALSREGLDAFYGEDKKCYLRNLKTQMALIPAPNPHRPFSASEIKRREQLNLYLQRISEDELIEDVLLPLFRQIGFHRITAAGHKDKQLEYGKDVWMKFTLPTQHALYFGMQVKKGKLDSSGVSKSSNANVAEILNQTTMMLGHEIFDPEIGKKVLVDHAFIVAGGEITKAARNWLGGRLDAIKRSQILFMDREDILNLFVVTGLPVPEAAISVPPHDLTDIPF